MSIEKFKIITVDGESACGKSTTGNYLANKFNYKHIDAGTIFRGLAYHTYINKINIDSLDSSNIREILLKNFYFSASDAWYNKQYISGLLATEDIALMAYRLGQDNRIQRYFIDFQRSLVDSLSKKGNGVIVSGRIGGSIVFPEATTKFYLTAPLKTKADRRKKQMHKQGFSGIRETAICNSLKDRDNVIKIIPGSNLSVCNKTHIIDTSQFSLENLPKAISAYF